VKKLMLDVEQLEVESFATGGADGAGGTVRAHNHTRGNHASCWETCGPSCGLTCPATCGFSCNGEYTCVGDTCAATCNCTYTEPYVSCIEPCPA